jgi:hypothetical protein
MEIMGAMRSKLRAQIVSRVRKSLEFNENVKRAPTFALLEVEPSQLEVLARQAGALSKQFDKVIVLLPELTTLNRVPQNFEVFEKTPLLHSRWQLLQHCDAGFVFPVSLAKPIASNHVTHLKGHLFAVGGPNAIALHNFGSEASENLNHKDGLTGLVPMPILDPDYAIFDQRFWGLPAETFVDEHESIAFSGAARAREFGLFCCPNEACKTSIPEGPSLSYERLDLAETLVRNPALLKSASLENIDFWSKTWDSLGVKSDPHHSDELEATLNHHLAKNSALNDKTTHVAAKIIGKTTNKKKVRP